MPGIGVGIGVGFGGRRRVEGYRWTSPASGALLPLGTPVHVRVTAPAPVDAATLTVGEGAPAAMTVVPRTGLRIAIMGQSNAVGGGVSVGRAAIAGVVYDELTATAPADFVATSTERLGLPSIQVRSAGQHGCEFGLVQELQRLGHSVASVCKFACNGSSLSALATSWCWQADQVGEIYDAAETWLLARQAEYSDTIDVLVWSQGESDAQLAGKATVYDANLAALAAALRTALGNANLIVLFPRLNAAGGSMTELATVRAQQALFGARHPVLNRMVDVDGIAMSDDYHYDSAGHDAIGALLARRIARSIETLWTPSAADPATLLTVTGTTDAVATATTRTVNAYSSVVEPDDIADLEYWWKGDAGISGSPVDSWTDAVGSLALANTSTARPAALAGGGITIADSNDVLKASGVDLATQRWMHSAATYVFVLDRADENATQAIFDTCNNAVSSVGIAIYGGTTGRVTARVLNGDIAAAYICTTGVDALALGGGMQVLVFCFDGSSAQIYIDTAASAAATDTTLAGALATETNASAQINAGMTARMTGAVREMIAYSRKLTTDEIGDIIAYESLKWSL